MPLIMSFRELEEERFVLGEMEPSEEGEWKKVSQMRSIVEAKDAGAKEVEVDDFMLRRFLRARDLNLERASEMFLRFLKWRRTAVPLGFISEKKIENELSQKKVLMLGFSKKGNPMAVGFASKHYPSKRDMEEFRSLVVYYLDKLCASMPGDQEKFIVIGDLKGWENELSQKKVLMLGFSKKGNPMAVGFASKHYPSKRDMEEFRSLVVYYLDKLCASMPGDQEKFIVIGDLKGWGYSNCDIRGYLACLEIVQSYYPERLEKAYLIHVPYLFMKAWRIIFPFIDKRTRRKSTEAPPG
ncbi:hypothetical protein HPP92_002782 [Vanilla planifolia]|uniref:CRAL-TRIO domain-containing protein n=1 Tax=Vanilla planifolia TaxID=51239 RepID=A0A835S953_VANPL|nr:hypothetical protein HPP92_002782 [Vanilla planifolia]